MRTLAAVVSLIMGAGEVACEVFGGVGDVVEGSHALDGPGVRTNCRTSSLTPLVKTPAPFGPGKPNTPPPGTRRSSS